MICEWLRAFPETREVLLLLVLLLLLLPLLASELLRGLIVLTLTLGGIFNFVGASFCAIRRRAPGVNALDFRYEIGGADVLRLADLLPLGLRTERRYFLRSIVSGSVIGGTGPLVLFLRERAVGVLLRR